MTPEYIFHSTCYDRELLRKEEICLDDNGIDYQVEIREDQRPVPLANFFEADIRVSETDFNKADRLLKEIIEDFS